MARPAVEEKGFFSTIGRKTGLGKEVVIGLSVVIPVVCLLVMFIVLISLAAGGVLPSKAPLAPKVDGIQNSGPNSRTTQFSR
jgi:hypothetical protein